jgi:spore germination protein PF
MPSLFGAIKINSISGGAVNFGDSLNISPKASDKTVSGAGGGGTGDFQIIVNGTSITNAADPDIADQNITANN